MFKLYMNSDSSDGINMTNQALSAHERMNLRNVEGFSEKALDT